LEMMEDLDQKAQWEEYFTSYKEYLTQCEVACIEPEKMKQFPGMEELTKKLEDKKGVARSHPMNPHGKDAKVLAGFDPARCPRESDFEYYSRIADYLVQDKEFVDMFVRTIGTD